MPLPLFVGVRSYTLY